MAAIEAGIAKATTITVLLTVAYDGTNYAGWQRQNNAVAVQQRLEEALEELFAQPIKLTATSRTDAGVHALGQRVVFELPALNIPINKLPQVVNAYLPPDIVVQAAETVPLGFNPRFAAKAKTYRYQFYNAALPNPLQAHYCAFVPRILDVNEMTRAAQVFVGTHDFTAFCASGSSAKTFVRQIFSCDITQNGELITLTIKGNGFLYNMVRIIAGTVLYCGLGKLKAADIPGIITERKREKAGKTMPACGLCLMEVEF